MVIEQSTEIQALPTSTGNLRVCSGEGCHKIAHHEEMDFCPTCDNYICAQCDCTCPVPSEFEAEWAGEAALNAA
jgi:hypothetical protein